ncbi:MAG: hypothetical protein LBF22_15620, partial [Deltaproteobacteria bacterium]|nr:hypothetical protein [Deltaproteobacteria bacterium]
YFSNRSACLIIPPEPSPNNLSFLQGCFRSPNEALFNALTGTFAVLTFCYDPDTSATFKVTVPGESTSCVANGNVTVKNGVVAVTSTGPLACDRENFFPPVTINCYPGDVPDTQAKCFLKESNTTNGFYEEFPLEMREFY